MQETDSATAAQYKVLAEQAAAIALADVIPQISRMERAISRLMGAEPEEGRNTIGPVSKWLAGIAAAVIGAIIVGGLFWVGSSVAEMQQTLARIDERQKAQTGQADSRFADYDRRITQLERTNNPQRSVQ